MGEDSIDDLVQRRLSELPHSARPRLRFDKVACRFLSTVKESLSAHVPDGKTVIFTISAPIRVSSRTVAALENTIRTHLARGSSNADLRELIEGNHIQLRIVNSGQAAPRVIGFVYTPHPGAAETVLDTAQALLK